jgi:hypothetical protein
MILHKGRPCELATSSVDALQIASHSSWWSDHVHSPQFQFPRGFQHPLDARPTNAEHLAMTVVPRPCASFLIMFAAIEPLPADGSEFQSQYYYSSLLVASVSTEPAYLRGIHSLNETSALANV